MNLTANEDMVLTCLQENRDDYCGFSFLSFRQIEDRIGLDRKKIRRACRSLARKGEAEFSSGLWTEDGGMAGSGYAATKPRPKR